MCCLRKKESPCYSVNSCKISYIAIQHGTTSQPSLSSSPSSPSSSSSSSPSSSSSSSPSSSSSSSSPPSSSSASSPSSDSCSSNFSIMRDPTAQQRFIFSARPSDFMSPPLA